MRSPHRSAGRREAEQRGFTLVELIVVMSLIAIISAVGMARFANLDLFAVQGGADQLVAGLRLAHGMAVAGRQTIYVTLGADPASLQVCLDAGCTQPVATADGSGQWLANASQLHMGTAAAFSFQADGTPSLTGSLQVQLFNSDGSVASPAIVVEQTSGHVHSP